MSFFSRKNVSIILIASSFLFRFSYLSAGTSIAPATQESKQNVIKGPLGVFGDKVAPQFSSQKTRSPTTVTQHKIERDSCAFDAFAKNGLSRSEAQRIVSASEPFLNMNTLKSNTPFNIEWNQIEGEPLTAQAVEIYPDPLTLLRIEKQLDGGWVGKETKYAVETKRAAFTGVVNSSLWESASEAGMDFQLISDLAEVFAWQIDFNREVRAGDRWRLVVEQRLVHGKHYQWGNVLAAEYENRGETHMGIRYPAVGNPAGFFDADGNSLRKMFLRAPLKYTRISSSFTLHRFHPILKKNRPHYGIDYAASTGTPILAIGDGVVTYAGWAGESGIMVKIRHNSVYSSAYLHMQKLPARIKVGVKVGQSDVVGYVGSTGLATGPHLHFSFFVNNSYVDPQGMKFPSADPVSANEMQTFGSLVKTMVQALPHWPSPLQMNVTTLQKQESRAISR